MDSQTTQVDRETGGTGQGAAVPPVPLTQAPTEQNGVVNDGPQQVVSLPQTQLESMRRVNAPKVQRREKWITIKDEAYEGFEFRIWVNYPQRLDLEIRSTDEDKIRAALKQVILEHNGWLDEEGNPYPPSTTDEFWKQIPNELAAVVLALMRMEAARLPNSLMRKWRDTEST